MMSDVSRLALASAAALIAAQPALAQEALTAPAPAEPQDEVAALRQQVAELQKAVDDLKKAMVQATPAWRGAPQFENKAAGWSFKPRGRAVLDAGYVGNPDEDVVHNRNLGFNTRFRRIRLGAEGTIPGGFGYKLEADFAGGSLGFGDVVLTYTPEDSPFGLTLGNFETYNGLEQVSSSRYGSFVERSAFTDAFINTRRIGLGASFATGDVRIGGGVFAAHSIDNSFDNNGWIAAGRATWSPKLGEAQLHLGLNAQYRDFSSNNGTNVSSSAGAPSTGQQARYRARPFSQTSDVRFVDTGAFAAKSDRILGVEAAGIFGTFHVTGEAQWLKANAYRAGATFADENDFFPTPGFVIPSGDPSFWGGYLEAGWYLTGETRGYRDGLWNRTKVLKPFSKGGWGALQVNGRIEYLDLDSERLKRGFINNFASGAAVPSINLTRGGRQLGLLGSLVWNPEDYVRFYLQYARAEIRGGPFSDDGFVNLSKPFDKREFGVDVLTTRAAIDF